MKRLKSILCICIAVMLVLSVVNISNKIHTASAYTYWNDYATKEPTYNASTDYFEISSPEQLAYFNKYLPKYINSKIMLTADINMLGNRWVPYEVKWTNSSRNNLFSGTFDGRNHTISNLNIFDSPNYAGFFSLLDYNSKVLNLNFKNCYVQNCLAYGGIVAGYLEGNSLIQNCNIINSSVSMMFNENHDNTVYGGGMFGFSYNTTIKNCMVFNTGVGFFSLHEPKYAYAGGIVGEANNSTISVCAFINSSVNIYTNDTCHVGGIVGRLSYKNSKGTSKIEKCYTEDSTITGGYNYHCKTAYVGGIAGSMEYGTIENCYNLSTITAKSSTTSEQQPSTQTRQQEFTHRGYLCGNNIPNHKVVFKSHQNTIPDYEKNGKITITYSCDAPNAYMGGICGYVFNPEDDCNILNCYNTGTFIGNDEVKEMITINLYGYYYDAKYKKKYQINNAQFAFYYNTIKNANNIANNYNKTNQNLFGNSIISENYTSNANNTYYYSNEKYNAYKFNITDMKFTQLVQTNNTSSWGRYFLDVREVGEYRVYWQRTGCGLPTTEEMWINYCMSYNYISIPTTSLNSWDGSDVNSIVSSDTSVWALNDSISPTPIIKDFYWIYSATKPA